MSMENWFAIKAYNSQTLYGFGTLLEAHRYCDELNMGRNYYWPYPLTTKQAEELGIYDDSDLGFSLSIAIKDAEEAFE